MKTFKAKFLPLVVTLVAMLSLLCEKVDAGYEGILVNLYGDDKGVGEVSMCTGMVWYNIFTQNVYEYPTFVQTVDYKPFTVNAKDGSEFIVDPTVSLKVVDGKSPIIFKKYRKDLDEIVEGTLYNYVKNAFRIQLNNFTTDYIVSNRDSIEQAIERHLAADLLKENFQLEQLTSGLKYPEVIVTAAEANRLKQQALTPQILEKMWIEKWDGTVPTVITGGNTSAFLDLSKIRK